MAPAHWDLFLKQPLFNLPIDGERPLRSSIAAAARYLLFLCAPNKLICSLVGRRGRSQYHPATRILTPLIRGSKIHYKTPDQRVY